MNESTRVSPPFLLARIAVIHAMAGKGIATSEIAAALGVDRSWVIRIAAAGLDTTPSNAAERAIARLAAVHDITKLGFGYILGESLRTVLAGGDKSEQVAAGKGGGRPRKVKGNEPPAFVDPDPEMAQKRTAAAKKPYDTTVHEGKKLRAARATRLAEPAPVEVPPAMQASLEKAEKRTRKRADAVVKALSNPNPPKGKVKMKVAAKPAKVTKPAEMTKPAKVKHTEADPAAKPKRHKPGPTERARLKAEREAKQGTLPVDPETPIG